MANGRRIIEGLESALESARGKGVGRVTTVHVPKSVDVKAIRQKLKMTQKEFALRFGFSLPTLRHWEQGQRFPDGAARVLLTVIDRNPEAVCEALSEAMAM